MRVRFATSCGTAILLVTANCRFPNDPGPTCDDDIKLCPKSSRTATSVTCDCRCSVGLTDASEDYEGRVAVCLPAELNSSLASAEQRTALTALEQPTYDQRIFNYCSDEVARFIRIAIKAQARVQLAACSVPVHCECSTKGTRRDSAACRSRCGEVACDTQSCRAVLQKGGKLDMSSCECSRAAVCGNVAPRGDGGRLCRDWLTSLADPPPNEAEP